MSEVLALKHRPSDFSEVVGQEGIIKQIKSALDKGILGHALLFSGTRGTGKTTTARIVARYLNPQVELKSLALLVAEVDAASNTGVDDVRQLLENIRYAAQGHRVLILDECHQLSKAAFNALLKSLEEPPANTTFILITTEPNKVPPTVRSRCQIYEFKDVELETLKQHYQVVANKENLKLSQEQLEEVALKAEGSVRDGLSLLQKYLAGEEVVVNSSLYFDLVGSIYNNDTVKALELVSQIRKSEEARTIIQTLEKWFYWSSLEFFGLKTPIREFFGTGAAQHFDLKKLQDLFSSCLQIERDLTATPNSKIVLEMGILKLSQVGYNG